MPRTILIPRRPCLYCGTTDAPPTGEHVVPKAIGGTRTIPGVCQRCNTGVLSTLDKELCEHSFVAIVASQEMQNTLWQAWDVDHAARDVLVEAAPVWVGDELDGFRGYPQITFEREGPEIRGDADEVGRFGQEAFRRVMVRAARNAYERYNRREKKPALHPERVKSAVALGCYRFPPRVFARASIAEIAEKLDEQSFILRFAEPHDRGFALRALSTLGNGKPINHWRHKPSSRTQALATFFDLGMTTRALIKIGVNLLAYTCRHTDVSRDTFPEAVRLVLGETEAGPPHFASNGFISADSVKPFARPGCHSFQLAHGRGMWRVHFSFFGGRVGARALFPGRSGERWTQRVVHAPICQQKWEQSDSLIYTPADSPVLWNNPTGVIPSLRLQSSSTRVVVEQYPRHERKAAATPYHDPRASGEVAQ